MRLLSSRRAEQVGGVGFVEPVGGFGGVVCVCDFGGAVAGEGGGREVGSELRNIV